MSTFLVTGATGKQGSAVLDALLAAGQKVRAWTRDASSPASRALAARAGVTVHQGSLRDGAALEAACRGCRGLFLNLMPSLESLSAEAEEGAAAVAAARAAGVRHAVYSTVAGVASPENDGFMRPGSFVEAYYGNKRAVERAVREAGFESWTVVRPGMFLTNFTLPDSGFAYPELARDGVLKSNYDADTAFDLLDPCDVGKFVAAAFLDPGRFHGKEIELAKERRTWTEIAKLLEKYSGKSITLQGYSEEEKLVFIGPMQDVLNKRAFRVDLAAVESWGIPMAGVEEYFEANRDLVVGSIGPA